MHRHRLKQEALSVAIAARAKGASFGEIELQLQNNGIDQELLGEIMMQVQGKTPQAQAEKNRSDMRNGVYWLVGGISVTFITYAVASDTGGAYIIAYGAVITGAVQFVRGWLKSRGRS